MCLSNGICECKTGYTGIDCSTGTHQFFSLDIHCKIIFSVYEIHIYELWHLFIIIIIIFSFCVRALFSFVCYGVG